MEKLKEFYNSSKSDIHYILILLGFFVFCSIIYWGSWGSLYIDNGREAYLPQLILQGKVLYKDIFAMYNPLSYQINAVIYAIFGANLNVLQMCGSIAAFSILSGLYLISRLFIQPFYSLAFCIFVTAQFIFISLSCVNYIIPYSYGMVYALMFFIWFVYFSLRYLKSDNNRFLYISSLMAGLSLANRYDFSICIIPFIILMFYKKESIKTVCLNVSLILLPLILSWSVLFIQGLGIEDFKNYLIFINNLFNTKEQQVFNRGLTRTYSFHTIKELILTFLGSITFLFVSSMVIKIILDKKNIFLRVILGIAIFYTYFHLTKDMIANKFIMFSWCCLSALVITVLGFKNNKKLMALIGIYAVLSCVRMNLILINLVSYSIYFILLPLLVNWVFFINSKNRFIEKLDIKKSLAVFLIVFAAIITLFCIYTKKTFFYEFNTPKGKIVNLKFYSIPFAKTIDWVKKNTNKNDRVLMLPEGPMINFITERPTENKYYHLIPNHIAALGEDNIVKDLYENPPEIVLINNLIYLPYGSSNICDNFGYIICTFVKTRYEFVTRYDSGKNTGDFYIDIYKLKKTD